MAGNLCKWPSGRRKTKKIRPSDGCKGDTVPSAVVRGYDLRKPGGHLGNVGTCSFFIDAGLAMPSPSGCVITTHIFLEDEFQTLTLKEFDACASLLESVVLLNGGTCSAPPSP